MNKSRKKKTKHKNMLLYFIIIRIRMYFVSKMMAHRMLLCVECSDFVCYVSVCECMSVREKKDDELNDGMMHSCMNVR